MKSLHDRLIFIDLNTDPTIEPDGKPAWVQPALRRLEQFEARELATGQSAYVFLTNAPFHRMLDAPLHIALAPFGLGIPDFSRPGSYRFREIYRRKRKHVDAHHIADAFVKYPQLPTTFDGSLPSDSLHRKPPVIIGETYLFERVKNLSGSTGGDLVATVTTATACVLFVLHETGFYAPPDYHLELAQDPHAWFNGVMGEIHAALEPVAARPN